MFDKFLKTKMLKGISTVFGTIYIYFSIYILLATLSKSFDAFEGKLKIPAPIFRSRKTEKFMDFSESPDYFWIIYFIDILSLIFDFTDAR
jgi:hypothetical protein